MAKVGVDIGHGNNTFPPSKGLYKNGKAYHEHDANSRVALRLTAKLKDAGHTVVQAQGAGKADVDLTTRTNKYKAEDVDLIISCHANAGAASAHGYASFYWSTDSKAKKLSDLYAEEIKKQGFELWGGSRPSTAGTWSNFHMCRVPSAAGIPAILVENGFMTNDDDFEWIFGSKKDEYAEKCATAAFNAIQRYLGGKTATAEPTKVATETAKEESSSNILQKGDKGSAVKDLQKNLIAKGFDLPKYGADGDYGDETVAAVKAMQKATGITVDGIYGPQSAAGLKAYKKPSASSKSSGPAVIPYPGKLIKKGSRGTDVKRIQRAVGVTADGIFGTNTEKAVKAYQKRHELSVDGIVGPKTWNKMF